MQPGDDAVLNLVARLFLPVIQFLAQPFGVELKWLLCSFDPPYRRNAIQHSRHIFRMGQLLGGGSQTVEFRNVLGDSERTCLWWCRRPFSNSSGTQGDQEQEERQQNEKRTAPTHSSAYTAAGAVVPP